MLDDFDAVFLGVGLGQSNDLGIEGEDKRGVINAIDYIAELRQADDKSKLPVGKTVVVIGGGMTAIDIAVQSRHLGAEAGAHGVPARARENECQRVRTGARADQWRHDSSLAPRPHAFSETIT